MHINPRLFKMLAALLFTSCAKPPLAPVNSELVRDGARRYYRCKDGEAPFAQLGKNELICRPFLSAEFEQCVQQISLASGTSAKKIGSSVGVEATTPTGIGGGFSHEKTEATEEAAAVSEAPEMVAARVRAIDFCIETARDAARRATHVIAVPVGSVIPFFLAPPEIKDLMQRGWLPADGRTVPNNIGSSLSGRQLPDLQNKFVRGGSVESDVVPMVPNTGGAEQYIPVVKSSGTTVGGGRVNMCPTGSVTIDTAVDETNCGTISVSAQVDPLVVLPPYRSLIYMVRVK